MAVILYPQVSISLFQIAPGLGTEDQLLAMSNCCTGNSRMQFSHCRSPKRFQEAPPGRFHIARPRGWGQAWIATTISIHPTSYLEFRGSAKVIGNFVPFCGLDLWADLLGWPGLINVAPLNQCWYGWKNPWGSQGVLMGM